MILQDIIKKKKYISEEQRKKKGKLAPNYRNGSSLTKYGCEWCKTLRRAIRERDNYICQLCNKIQADRAFSVHHIDYDKNNNNTDNLITLCNTCHTKTNFNREKWKIILTQKLK